MLATSHALVAGIIVKTIPDPIISLPLVVISHFALDLIPHWDVSTDQIHHGNPLTLAGDKNRPRLILAAAFDVSLGLALTFWLFQSLNPLLLFFAIILAQLPDWLEMPYYFLGIKLPFSIWVKKLQHNVHARLLLPWGLATQIFIIIPLLWLTLR